jgi:hypothetical protein
MYFAVFEEMSVKGSYRFQVISALKIRENRSLAGIGGRCRHLAEISWPMDRSILVSYSCSLETSHPAFTVSAILALLKVAKRTQSGNQQLVAPAG